MKKYNAIAVLKFGGGSRVQNFTVYINNSNISPRCAETSQQHVGSRPILLFSPGHQTVRQLIRDRHSLGLRPPGSPYQTKFCGTVSPRTSKRQSNITQLSKLFTATHEA